MIKSEVCVWDKETAILFTIHTSKILQNTKQRGPGSEDDTVQNFAVDPDLLLLKS